MTSRANFNSEKNTDDKTVVIDIYEKLEKLPTVEQNCHVVCICRIPKSLTSMKPEAFMPQLVGLGPYHHFRCELTMTDELKLGVAKRVLKDLLPDNKDLFLQRFQNILPHVQAFYHHADVNFTFDSRTLLYILTVDGLFMLALLRNGTVSEGRNSSFDVLTGKHCGMPLVNSAGVELTIDGIMRDIFMLENQIPTHILKQMTRVNVSSNEIQQVDPDLGSTMLNFCKTLCPLVYVQNLSKDPEAYDHLLDLMYHLIEAPELEPQSDEFEPHPDPEPRPVGYKCIWFFTFLAILGITITTILVYLILFIWRLIISFFRYLFRTIQWAFGPLPNFFHMLNRGIDSFQKSLSRKETKIPIYKALRQCIGQIKESVGGFFQSQDMTKWEEGARPSATELLKAGIHLVPIEGGISSIKFDEGRNFQIFYLPCIRVNVISEVIITNLMAYESLTKSNGLIFTWFIELMSSLIHSAEDVKVLVHEKILETQLSDEDVLQIFNGMRKMIRPTKIPKLEEEIEKVNAEFKVKWYDVHNPLHYRIIFLMVFAAIAFGALAAMQMLYCAFNPTIKFCKPPQAGDYGRNNNNFVSYVIGKNINLL